MTRLRSMMASTIPLLLAATVLLASTGPVGAAEPPPNVILVLADDLGYGDIGPYGQQLIRTPSLDRIAAEGVTLTAFYSSASVCTASRGGLLTGRYPVRLGLTADVARPTNDIALDPAETTLGEAFQSAGYRTACIGKWHLGHRAASWPTRNGFDLFFGLPYSNDMKPLALYRGEAVVEEPVDQSTLTERYVDEAIRFIAADPERPFFVYLAHSMPHVPLHVSPRLAGRSRAGLYGDVVEAIDVGMGELLAALERLGLDERTVVVFTSDNGPWWEGSAGSYRDRKGSSWEGGQRVPFLARWPGHLRAGTRSGAIAMNIDVFPTLLALAGLATPADLELDGRDLSPVLAGSQDSPHELLLLFQKDRLAAVRTQRWKLVMESYYRSVVSRIGHPSYYYSPGLLFDLERDPGEHFSFTREHPGVAADLRHRAEELYRRLVGRDVEGDAVWFR